ncbi:acyl carrier protein [Paenibacillus xylaniclasticus]|uniref:acyl carrier protein n=1 Tax=Paenibacillus xylaniclasticus TaxID=588083 RepID=UPI0013DF5944|nr:acyl carrier protein [Paenibacillus xylaniclasticus]
MTLSNLFSLEEIILAKINKVLNKEISVDYNSNLIDEGLDSIKCIDLIVHLEMEFDIEFDDEDLVIENFSTIHKISKQLTDKYGVTVRTV